MNPKRDNLPGKAKAWDSKTTSPGHAYQAIFNRRLQRGQSFASLCLGWREFPPSYFGPFRPKTHVLASMPDMVIPSMLREVFSRGYLSPYDVVYDHNVEIKGGVLCYPKGGNCFAK